MRRTRQRSEAELAHAKKCRCRLRRVEQAIGPDHTVVNTGDLDRVEKTGSASFLNKIIEPDPRPARAASARDRASSRRSHGQQRVRPSNGARRRQFIIRPVDRLLGSRPPSLRHRRRMPPHLIVDSGSITRKVGVATTVIRSPPTMATKKTRRRRRKHPRSVRSQRRHDRHVAARPGSHRRGARGGGRRARGRDSRASTTSPRRTTSTSPRSSR